MKILECNILISNYLVLRSKGVIELYLQYKKIDSLIDKVLFSYSVIPHPPHFKHRKLLVYELKYKEIIAFGTTTPAGRRGATRHVQA